jgi:signal peptidase I
MEPTIKMGEVFSVDWTAYGGTGPNRWDVVIFESPLDAGRKWTSRIVGLPGEIVEIRSGKIVIDGREEAVPSHVSIDGYKLPQGNLTANAPHPVTFPYKIPAGSYFVLGDNVSNAFDSRYWGGLDRSKIFGKVIDK